MRNPFDFDDVNRWMQASFEDQIRELQEQKEALLNTIQELQNQIEKLKRLGS